MVALLAKQLPSQWAHLGGRSGLAQHVGTTAQTPLFCIKVSPPTQHCPEETLSLTWSWEVWGPVPGTLHRAPRADQQSLCAFICSLGGLQAPIMGQALPQAQGIQKGRKHTPIHSELEVQGEVSH